MTLINLGPLSKQAVLISGCRFGRLVFGLGLRLRLGYRLRAMYRPPHTLISALPFASRHHCCPVTTAIIISPRWSRNFGAWSFGWNHTSSFGSCGLWGWSGECGCWWGCGMGATLDGGFVGYGMLGLHERLNSIEAAQSHGCKSVDEITGIRSGHFNDVFLKMDQGLGVVPALAGVRPGDFRDDQQDAAGNLVVRNRQPVAHRRFSSQLIAVPTTSTERRIDLANWREPM